MDMTIIQQGQFVSDGTAEFLNLRSGIDWLDVYNYTVANADQVAAIGVQYYWQLGMPNGSGLEFVKAGAGVAGANLAVVTADGSFLLVDSSVSQPSAAVALSAVSGANPPVVTTADTSFLADGVVVRMVNVAGAQQLGGLDFTANVINGTTFSLLYMDAIAAGGAGSFRVVPFDPYFYPQYRYITHISRTNPMQVQLSVTNLYTLGQEVRLQVPAGYGMGQANGLLGAIVAIDAVNNIISLNIDATGFDAWQFPLTAAAPFTPALVIPVGEVANAAIIDPNDLGDATENRARLGMLLAAGADAPAGQDGDLIFWKAGKSFNV